ncbi:DUF305 domain-containing protein [Amycolatopsis sp. cg9]|uniref:DUF305 domain-containing protein n=1 Tax=Amycolatopsis sp. cg9 TaxID=3238801 RepID=UPI0035232B32
MTRKFLAGLLLPALVLTGCSTPVTHNDADIAFAQQMIPHHEQAVRMAEPVPQHTGNPQVIALADGIAKAQQPEIDQLETWLGEWGASSMPGMDHGAMPGMGELDTLRDAAYDRKWLQLMVEHHRGAIDMARTELAQGADGDAKAMAQRIVDTQQSEVDRMTTLLG